MKEAEYQEYLVKRIYDLLPGKMFVDTIVIINDPNYIQGIPDLTVLHKSRFALLEVKLSEKSKEQPNQRWYVGNWRQYVFTAFIYPENEEEVLLALQQALDR
jgi:hypothetical protein